PALLSPGTRRDGVYSHLHALRFSSLGSRQRFSALRFGFLFHVASFVYWLGHRFKIKFAYRGGSCLSRDHLHTNMQPGLYLSPRHHAANLLLDELLAPGYIHDGYRPRHHSAWCRSRGTLVERTDLARDGCYGFALGGKELQEDDRVKDYSSNAKEEVLEH